MTNYRVHGMTDDTDTCEICGKIELRRVVMLAVLDVDGNTEEIIYAGTTCASRKLAKSGKRVPAARVRDAAAAAARVMESAKSWADEFRSLRFNDYLKANWTHAENFGVQATRNAYDSAMAEVAKIDAGSIAGTRYEAMLPKI